MEFLSSPKSTYLLQASLDVLHFESREWQEEVGFMSDEINFLHKLYRQFMEKLLPEKHKKHAIDIQGKLKLFATEVHQMQQTIHEHEKYLADILQNKTYVSDEDYRAKHKVVKHQVDELIKEFRQLKKEMFHWSEDVLS